MNRQKVSAMVIDFAWDYIGQGESFEQRKYRLTLACTAWNYACVPVEVGREQLNKYMGEYRKWNPDATEDECKATKLDMEKLMQEKRQKYPDVLLQIIKSDLVPGEDEERVVVAFTSQELP